MKNLTASHTSEEERRERVRGRFQVWLWSHPADRLKGAEQVEILLEVAGEKEVLPYRLLCSFAHSLP